MLEFESLWRFPRVLFDVPGWDLAGTLESYIRFFQRQMIALTMHSR